MGKIKVALVDDQQIFRQSLCQIIRGTDGLELVAEAADHESLFSKLKTLAELPDVLIMDMDLPGMDGMELNSLLSETYPLIKVIVLSIHVQERLIAKMISAGAAAYLAKNCDIDELVYAIQTVYKTGCYINRDMLMAVQQAAKSKSKHVSIFNSIPTSLSEREIEVLREICKEKSSAEIAEILFLSPRTVEGHRNNLLLKTQSKNIAGLVLFAIRHKIVEIF